MWLVLVLAACGEGGADGDTGEDLACRPETNVGLYGVARADLPDRCLCERCGPDDGDPLDGNEVTRVQCADGWENVDDYDRALDEASRHCGGS
jgi:hypothetical protein